MMFLTMTAGEVASELQYRHRSGLPNGRLIRDMVRRGEFPAPIDSSLPAARWRWSRAVVEAYTDGSWALARRHVPLPDSTDRVVSIGGRS